MSKRYSQLRVDVETANNFKNKTKKMNMELKKMGIQKKKITQIQILNLLSKQPLFLDSKDLTKLARMKKYD